MAPPGDAFIISHTNAHRHVAVPPRLAIFWRMANFEFAIMAPRGAEWRHSFARMAPFWRRNGAILAVDRIRHFLAPFGAILSPLGATWRHAGAIMAPKWVDPPWRYSIAIFQNCGAINDLWRSGVAVFHGSGAIHAVAVLYGGVVWRQKLNVAPSYGARKKTGFRSGATQEI